MGSADNPGIIPRLCNALFDRIRQLSEDDPSITCKVTKLNTELAWGG